MDPKVYRLFQVTSPANPLSSEEGTTEKGLKTLI
jgi:hypothetical protein